VPPSFSGVVQLQGDRSILVDCCYIFFSLPDNFYLFSGKYFLPSENKIIPPKICAGQKRSLSAGVEFSFGLQPAGPISRERTAWFTPRLGAGQVFS
jgi:hypothetical protein